MTILYSLCAVCFMFWVEGGMRRRQELRAAMAKATRRLDELQAIEHKARWLEDTSNKRRTVRW